MGLKNLILTSIFTLFSICLLAQNVYLMPMPKSMALGSNKFVVDQEFSVGVYGPNSKRLEMYATRVLQRINGRTGKFIQQAIVSNAQNPATSKFKINYKKVEEVALGMDESYELTINNNQMLLSANTDIGAMRGLETLSQLLSSDANGYYFPQVKIEDEPRFSWRGLLIDVGRHFMPVSVIKRNIDGLAMVKMNVLHLHLTEDQGFRIESKKFPKLHEKGSDGLYYTQAQIKDIVQYAKDRGIRVIPEFDLPGHATSWLVGYPELASEKREYAIERHFGVFDPTLDPTRKTTYDFLGIFFEEMAALFPDDYWHIGGDENNGNQWKNNAAIQQFMQEQNLADNHALQRHFNQKVLAILSKLDKKMVGWDEIFQPDLPKDIMIQSWRGKESMVEAAKQGYRSILSNGYYIDMAYNAEQHYTNDPIPVNSGLKKEEQKLILGGEATMWSELVSSETVDSRIWPRTAAIAERFWSRRSVNDIEDMYIRLDKIEYQLELVGLTHLTYQNKLMRRITGNQNIAPLQVFIDGIEPQKGYDRHRSRKYTSYDPLTLIADIAKPDAKGARKFKTFVASWLRNPNNRAIEDELGSMLARWKNNHVLMQNLANTAPVLQQSISLSKELSDIASLGLEALNHTISHNDEWKKEAITRLDNLSKPISGCQVAIAEEVKILVQNAK